MTDQPRTPQPKPEPLDPGAVRQRFHARATVPAARSPEILADDYRAIGDLAAAVEELGQTVDAIEAIARAPFIKAADVDLDRLEALMSAPNRGALLPKITPGEVIFVGDATLRSLMRDLRTGEPGRLATPSLADFADRALARLTARAVEVGGWKESVDATPKGRRRNAAALADLIACAIAFAATYTTEAPDLQHLVETRVAELVAIRFGYPAPAQAEEPQP